MKYALLAAGLCLAACATDPVDASAANDRDCFYSSQVSGFNVVDDRTVKIDIGASREYLLTTNRSVNDLRRRESLGVRGSPNGLICTGNGLGVELFGGDAPNIPWAVTGIARAPAAAAAQ